MAVSSLGSSFVTTNSSNPTVTATPAVGDLIIIVGGFTGNVATPTFSDNNSSGAYTVIASALKAASADQFYVAVRNTLIGAASSTVFTMTRSGATSGGGLVVIKVTGMSKVAAAAIRSSGTQANQTTGTPAPVLAGGAALTLNSIITAVFNDVSPAGVTIPTGYTDLANLGYSTPTAGLRVASKDSGVTASTISWGSAGGNFASLVIEVNVSDSGTLSATLGALTSVSAATVLVKGSLSATLGALTSVSAATVLVKGSLSATLGACVSASPARTSIYFSAAGSNTAPGDGSITHPYRDLTPISFPISDTNLYFNQGDTFTFQPNFMGCANVSVLGYGSSASQTHLQYAQHQTGFYTGAYNTDPGNATSNLLIDGGRTTGGLNGMVLEVPGYTHDDEDTLGFWIRQYSTDVTIRNLELRDGGFLIENNQGDPALDATITRIWIDKMLEQFVWSSLGNSEGSFMGNAGDGLPDSIKVTDTIVYACGWNLAGAGPRSDHNHGIYCETAGEVTLTNFLSVSNSWSGVKLKGKTAGRYVLTRVMSVNCPYGFNLGDPGDPDATLGSEVVGTDLFVDGGDPAYIFLPVQVYPEPSGGGKLTINGLWICQYTGASSRFQVVAGAAFFDGVAPLDSGSTITGGCCFNSYNTHDSSGDTAAFLNNATGQHLTIDSYTVVCDGNLTAYIDSGSGLTVTNASTYTVGPPVGSISIKTALLDPTRNFRRYVIEIGGITDDASTEANGVAWMAKDPSTRIPAMMNWVKAGLSPGAAGITGTASFTLGALVSSATGTVLDSGVAIFTLGAATLAATGTALVMASSTPTLGALTLSSTGTVGVLGTLSGTLDTLTIAATATSLLTATLTTTLGVATLSGSGTALVAGSSAAILDDLSLDAQGTSVVAGSVAVTLEALTLISASRPIVIGTVSALFDAATLSGSGTALVAGSSAAILDDLSLDAQGTAPVVAALDQPMDDAGVVGVGVVIVAGDLGQSLDSVILTAAGNVDISGSLNAILGDLTLVASVASGIAGDLDVLLEGLGLEASGSGVAGVPVVGIVSTMLAPLTASASGQVVTLLTPASRTFRVPAEPRTRTVGGETRLVAFQPENRTLVVPVSRFLDVPPQGR